MPAISATLGTSDALSAVQRAKIRRAVGARSAEAAGDGELNVIPFLDIVVNIVIFVLASLAVAFTATIEAAPPNARPALAPTAATGLQLTVMVVGDGFAVKAFGGNVGPGCEPGAPGLAVPKRNHAYDFGALTACAKKLGHAPGAERETHVRLTANPDVDYATVIRTTDALRSDPSGAPLFPEVHFQVAR